MRLYPAPDRMVRDPITRAPISESGIEVATIANTAIPVDVYWRRRLRDGDVSSKGPTASEVASGHDHDQGEEHSA